MKKLTNLSPLIVLLVFTLASCTMHQQNTVNHIKSQQTKIHWSYHGETGPEHWAEIEKDSECGGEHQSPINILTIDTVVNANLTALDIQYASSTKIHDVINNGHSIQYDFEAGDYVNYQGDEYALKQIHFHEPAEHTIDGVRYPLAIHMVHQSSKGAYLVLAVMAIEGITSAPFAFLESYLPLQKGETKNIDKAFNLNLNLPNNKGYYHYTGSLTTPPCSEGVQWFVFKEPITVSLAQVNVLNKLMPINNYRYNQPLNGRTVEMTK